MSKSHPLFLAVAFPLIFYGQKASAEASGPDYFQIKADKAVNFYERNDHNAKVMGIIPASTTGLKNLGCTGFVTFEEWRKMRAEEQAITKEEVWCKISYKDQMGWIQNIYLGENGKSSSPTFDCKKAKGEIEALICSNPAFINLDHQSDRYLSAGTGKSIVTGHPA